MSSVKKNFYYNILYQLLTLIMPIITAPYVSRVLGAEGQGIFSYTYSIAQYFILFAMLGVSNYGNRTIAKNRDDKGKISKEFWSIYALQIGTTLISSIIYIIYIFIFESQYKMFALIQLIYVCSAFLDINWFFFGIEKFKLTVTRNIIIKILSVCSIFVFVKVPNDLWKYAIIMTGATFISQLSLWPFLKKEINFVKPTWKDIRKHIRPNLTLFVPVIAVSIYKIMDKIMIGMMSTIENVGYYENAEKIINVPLSFITALGTVMLPRMSNLVIKGKKKEMNQYINKSMEFITFMSIPLALGMIAVGTTFAPIFFGDEFYKSGQVIQTLAITIVFISWANVIRTQFLIPNERDKTYIQSVCLGAVVNVIVNSILIPTYGAVGAAVGTIFAEFAVMFYQTWFVRHDLNIKIHLSYLMKFLAKGLIMYIIVISLELFIDDKLSLLIVQVITGAIVYFTLNYKYIYNNILMPVIDKIFEKKGKEEL